MALELSGDPQLVTRSPYNAAVQFVDRRVEEGMGNRIAFLHEDGQTTYAELYGAVNQAGNLFRDLGVQMEDRVALLCYDSIEFVSAFFGAVKVGAVPVPTNTMLSAADYLYILNDCRACVAVVEEALWPQIAGLVNQLPYLRCALIIQRDDSAVEQLSSHDRSPCALLDFREAVARMPRELVPANTLYDDMGFWLYTSGSTGRPKGVVHLQHDMEVSFRNYAQSVLGVTQSDRLFSASKLFFAYGLGNGMYFPLGAGATGILLRDKVTPERVCEWVVKYRPTLFFGVPSLYAAIVEWCDRTQHVPDFSSVRYGVSAGEPLPAAVFHRFRSHFGVEILDGIGSTEATHIYISNRPGDIRPGSTGHVVPGYQVKIVDSEGRDVPPGEPGQLLLKGDSIAQGYWNLHQQTCSKFRGEWYVTGDRYYRDVDGYFYYCGREDDMLKSGGIWVSPIEVEATLLEHPLVVEAAVIGVKDAQGIEHPVAYVVLKDRSGAPEQVAEELRRHVRDRLAHYKCPKQFVFTDSLPKTVTGKIQRFKLRETAEQGLEMLAKQE
ncbi:benzoate-CoA ligase family protein [Alicyclobacillus vulcanalis]|uniref:Benzoate-CoA ligase n=2 Tax=Alicyclobacillus TaxID=29330 RepID=A0A1N7LL49_9BACL|nr:benzoate-CoA ligase family protein [Alicyclobacillus vulcanalis]SIS74522.1 benzoate-CoA ligase [Alicyclobacillus vulcanalis]